jgi:hypothetical protein
VPLLTQGNAKLGPSIWHFNLPAGVSCPGRSELCSVACYATHGNYRRSSVQRKYEENWRLATTAPLELHRRLDTELTMLGDVTVRIHTSGDFFSADYIAMWSALTRVHPRTRFFAYTRSWRVSALLSELHALRERPNVRLWASSDDETGPPPPGWREARIGEWAGYATCPEQTGRKPSCAACGLCFADRLRPDARLAFKLH